MNINTVSIVIVGDKATLKTPDVKDTTWTVKTNRDLQPLIKVAIDRYGIQCNIRINNTNTGKITTFNNEYVRRVIYPTYIKHKRVVYRPDRLVTISVSDKDIKQEKLDRLTRQIEKAMANGDKDTDAKLCKLYLKTAGSIR